MRNKAHHIITVILAILCTTVCLRIEVLNFRAGDYLPRKNYTQEENPKWRVLVRPRETLSERYEAEYRYEHNLQSDTPLPSNVADIINKRVNLEAQKHAANSRLRSMVASWGLLQYFLSLILMIMGSVFSIKTHGKPSAILGLVCTVIGFATLCIALYRGYFTSLGW